MAKIIARIAVTFLIVLLWFLYCLFGFDAYQPGKTSWATHASIWCCLVAIGFIWLVGW